MNSQFRLKSQSVTGPFCLITFDQSELIIQISTKSGTVLRVIIEYEMKVSAAVV